MNAELRLKEGVAVAEELEHVLIALAESSEAHRTATYSAYSDPEVCSGKTAEIRNAQAREYASPLQTKIDQLEARATYLRAKLRLIETTPAVV